MIRVTRRKSARPHPVICLVGSEWRCSGDGQAQHGQRDKRRQPQAGCHLARQTSVAETAKFHTTPITAPIAPAMLHLVWLS